MRGHTTTNWDDVYELCPFMAQQNNFPSYRITHDNKNQELKDPPSYRMPIRGEKYDFTFIPSNTQQISSNLQECLSQFENCPDANFSPPFCNESINNWSDNIAETCECEDTDNYLLIHYRTTETSDDEDTDNSLNGQRSSSNNKLL